MTACGGNCRCSCPVACLWELGLERRGATAEEERVAMGVGGPACLPVALCFKVGWQWVGPQRSREVVGRTVEGVCVALVASVLKTAGPEKAGPGYGSGLVLSGLPFPLDSAH